MDLEIRSVIHYCYLRGMDPLAAEAEMKPVYCKQMCHLKTIRNWYKRFDEGISELSDMPRSGRPVNNSILESIKDLLEEEPFISAKRMCEVLNIPKSTLLLKLHNELGLVKVNLRWIPHTLTEENKKQRVELSCKILDLLEKGPSTWNSILTGDQTWIYWDNPQTSKWIEKGSERPTCPKLTISAQKTMITVFFGYRGIVLIKMLPKDKRFNSQYMVDDILPSLEEKVIRYRPKSGLKGIKLHIDNARSHNSKMTMQSISNYKIVRIPHPPYSPDIAPCDFWLFGKLKEYLKGKRFDSETELFDALLTFSMQILKNEITRVFNEWIKRLHEVIENQGEYVHK